VSNPDSLDIKIAARAPYEVKRASDQSACTPEKAHNSWLTQPIERGHTDRVADEDIAEVEEALASIVRLVGLPRVHERVMSLAGLQLDPSVYPLLRRVGDFGPLRLSELTRLLGVDMSTASRKVKQLELEGFLVREADNKDGRASILTLSDKGTDMLLRLRTARHALFESVFASWPAGDLAALAPLLRRAADDLSTYAIDPPVESSTATSADFNDGRIASIHS
jgi:DNA-binding MarR family transcriptional regulator